MFQGKLYQQHMCSRAHVRAHTLCIGGLEKDFILSGKTMDCHSGTRRSLHLRALWLAARECSRESRMGFEDAIESLRELGSFHSAGAEGLVQVPGTARQRTCSHIVLLLWPSKPDPPLPDAKEEAVKWLSATLPGKKQLLSPSGMVGMPA